MKDVTVAVRRSKTHESVPALDEVHAQVDQKSEIVVGANGQAIPVYYYEFYGVTPLLAPNLILQGDLLTDLDGTQYRVSGRPEYFDNGYMEVMLTNYVEVTP